MTGRLCPAPPTAQLPQLWHGMGSSLGHPFPQHPQASACCISPSCAHERLSRVCRWGLVEALSRQAQAAPAAPQIFLGFHTPGHPAPAAPLSAEAREKIQCGTELVAQLCRNQSQGQSLAGAGRADKAAASSAGANISLHLSCSPEGGTSGSPWLDCWFTVRLLWAVCKGEVWGCQKERRNLHFWKVTGSTDFWDVVIENRRKKHCLLWQNVDFHCSLFVSLHLRRNWEMGFAKWLIYRLWFS